MIYVFLLVVSGVLAAVGALGLMTTMSLTVLERRRELGVLRALGASPAAVSAIVVLEGSVIGILSWALGSLVAWPTSRVLGNGVMLLMVRTDLDFVFASTGVIVWLAVCVGLAAAASFVPAWTASRRRIRESIEYE